METSVADKSTPVKKNEAGNCRHFTIRGYAAEMRRKNKSLYDPFASGSSRYNLEQLPPLIIPKNRYWRCEGGVGSKCWQSELLSDDPCTDAAVAPPEMQQNAVIEISSDGSPPGNNSEIRTSSFSDGKEISDDAREMTLTYFDIRGSSSSHGKEMSADIGDMAFSDGEYVSRNIENQKNGGGPFNKSSPSQGERVEFADSSQLNNNGLEHPTNQDISSSDVPDIRAPIVVHKCTGGAFVDLFHSQKENTAEDERGVSAHEPVGVGSVHLIRTPSTPEEEHDNASSDSERTLDGVSDCRQNYGKSINLPRRKARKVRLLTDLLSGKDGLEINRVRKQKTLFNSIATTSNSLRSLVARENLAPRDDLWMGKQCPPSKRKTSHLGGSRSLEIRGPAKVSKKLRSARVCPERPHVSSEASNSEPVESHRSKKKIGRPKSSLSNKTLIDVVSDLGGNHVVVGAVERPVALMDTLDDGYTACSETEEENSLNLKKRKRKVVENRDKSLSPANKGKAPSGTNRRKSTTKEIVASDKVCLDLSLGRALNLEGTSKDNIHKRNPAYLQQMDRPDGCPLVKNKSSLGQSSLLNNPSPSIPVREAVHWDLCGRLAQRFALELQKQNSSALSEKNEFILQEKMDASGRNKEVQGLVGPKRQNDQRGNKAPQKEYSNDIPMDIVDLMAKNQYERKIAGGEGRSISKRVDCTSRGSIGINRNHPVKWVYTRTPGTMNIPNGNATNGIAAAFDSHLEGNQMKLFSTSSENPKKLSNQYHVSGSGSQPSEGATPAWLSKNKNVSYSLGISQKLTFVSNNIESNAFSVEMQHKGRTVSDIKQKELQLVLPKPRKGELCPKPRGSLDPYADEVVPAMHLLSLMDKGLASNAAYDADANRFLGIPSSRSDYHPRSSLYARHNVMDRSFPSHQPQGPSIYSAGKTSTQHLSSFSVGFTGQMSFRSQNYDESRNWGSPIPLGVANFQNSRPANGNVVIPRHPSSWKVKQHRGKGEGVCGASNSLMILPQYDGLGNSPEFIDLQAINVSGISLPKEKAPEVGNCSLNRNPADFSNPEVGNKFTIDGRDLKLQEKKFYRPRSNSGNVDGRKKRGVTKESAVKKHARPHASLS